MNRLGSVTSAVNAESPVAALTMSDAIVSHMKILATRAIR